MHEEDVPEVLPPSASARIQKHVPLGLRAAAAQTCRSAATETILGIVEGPSTDV